MLAAIVQKSLPDIFPHRVRAAQPQRVGVLDFHNPEAAQTLHAQHRARDFGQAPLLDRHPGRAIERGVVEHRSPPAVVRRRRCWLGAPQFARHLLHLLFGRHSP